MIGILNNIASWLLGVLNQIFNLYMTNIVLFPVLVLWVLDRIFGIFDILRRR